MDFIDLSIIIVHWNTPELLRKQLGKLSGTPSREGSHRSTKKSILSGEVIVIDNTSDKSLSWIIKEFPHVKLIENKKNVGYATACNQGATHAKGEWLLFLNPDVEITPDLINQLIKSAERSNFDACSPHSSSSGYEKVLPTPWILLTEFTPLRFLASPFARLGMTAGDKTLFGGCLLIKKNVLKHIGGWDEDFFLWFEDSDLTLRLKKAGFSIGFLPINIPHIGGVSFDRLTDKKRKELFFDSMNIFAKKHFSMVGKAIVEIIRLRYTV